MKGYVVTGTDTDVGKTVFAAGLAQAMGASYWKPVQAGLDGGSDSQRVARLAPAATILPEAHVLRTPCSPHEAARIDGVTIGSLDLPDHASPIVVEGAGGALVPYAEGLLAADLFARWNLPAVIVARTALGTISHTLMTIEVLRARGIAIAGVAFVGAAEPVAETAITRIGKVPHLGRLPWLDPLDAETLAQAFADFIRTDLLT
ncbi:ATP-dependent dethiobiotin synthetase BioD [Erythrobacter arachoides]|uniref:ATP-dependent dethiobiotin synthetase BioD n=1 Tax=Aurantiacibacter arachoides TaxID=1850444 RepID=A0A845A129_9SPHN|nr:dethiobiotin synthase [Aurantiacibacter arachoides]MXO93835.1 ATP-dependent dethiobiotin synthetase BioD [Aurantiacibacter arachoides]GGD46344.1 ATP-dependent dethiobiotin synthetase BioD [Aurantiacibacter arachoides]